jgi:hypothetical protein
MPGKTLVLIGILALVTIVLLGLALYNTPQTVKTPTKPAQKILKTDLTIAQPVASSSAYTVDIMLSTERTKITVVQIELSYNPKVLSNIDIVPGTFFSNPTILLKKIDKVNGRISYLLGIGLGQKPVTAQQGQVAVLKFTPLLRSSTATIDFASQSQVNAAGVVSSVLTSTKGLQFQFGPIPTAAK